MVEDLDRQLKKIKTHLNSASDYAQRAKRHVASDEVDQASTDIRRASDEIDTAIGLVNKLRRQL
jgi:hypothetical protein